MPTTRFLLPMLALSLTIAGPAAADPAVCQKQLAAQLAKLSKTSAKLWAKCNDNENLGKVAGPCPDSATQLKVSTVQTKVVTKLGTVCSLSDLSALGLRTSDCAYESEATGVEAACAALPVTTPTEAVACLACWQQAEVAETLGVLYASHAVDFCQGAVDATSAFCSDLGCTTPLPTQRDLGDTGENDCQKAIGKGGIKHLAAITKILQKCALAGGTKSSCDADLAVQTSIDKAKLKVETLLQNKCGANRNPEPVPSFCCRTTGNQCVAAADETACALAGGDVQYGKTCGGGGTCQPVPGQEITWWGFCPAASTCPGPALANTDDISECVDEQVDRVVDDVLCLQFPNQGWNCSDGSPSGAFLE